MNDVPAIRNAIMAQLAATLEEALQNDFGPECRCTSDARFDIEAQPPLGTPSIRIVELERTTKEPETGQQNLRVRFVVYLKRREDQDLDMQYYGVQFEGWLDAHLPTNFTVSGTNVACFQDAGQTTLVDGGLEDCWVAYEATVQYFSCGG
jgi:hypothetical protein